MSKQVEYQVRPVTRFVVTRWHCEDQGAGKSSGGCETIGEFPSEAQAMRVASAVSVSDESGIAVVVGPRSSGDHIGIAPV